MTTLKTLKKKITRFDELLEENMPSSVIKLKQKFNDMAPTELHTRFKTLANNSGKSIEHHARESAWRHGYGNMSSYYWDKIKDIK